MAETKRKGDLAELRVAHDLIRQGHRVAIPFGEDWDFDLVLQRDSGHLERVQVKYTESNGEVITVRCRSQSLTNGRVRAVKQYTEAMIDWMAVYDATTDACYYIPSSFLGTGRSQILLRLVPAKNGQTKRVNVASKFAFLGPSKSDWARRIRRSQKEDGASGIRTHDLPDANRTL